MDNDELATVFIYPGDAPETFTFGLIANDDLTDMDLAGALRDFADQIDAGLDY